MSEGQPLFSVDDRPVFLLYGDVPAYRTLKQGMTGADVKELNADLVALGLATSDALHPADKFTAATKDALKELQANLGLPATGRLPLGQADVLPGPIRVTAVRPTVGTAAGPGPVLTATSTTRQVTAGLPAKDLAELRVGDRVTITLPDGRTTPGRVTSIGKDAAGHPAAVQVTIAPTRPHVTGTLDQAPVQVAFTTRVVRGVLAVPVGALLADGGGPALRPAGGSAGHPRPLQPVTVGLVDDSRGLVQVSGAGVHAGQRIELPAVQGGAG